MVNIPAKPTKNINLSMLIFSFTILVEVIKLTYFLAKKKYKSEKNKKSLIFNFKIRVDGKIILFCLGIIKDFYI